MQRLVDIDVDPEFKIHTSCHNNFFLLRTKVLVDGKTTEIRPVKEGSFEEPALTFCYSGNTIATKLWPIANTFSPIFHQCGVYHVDTFYYEQSPLFHVVFSSESCLKKFLSEIGSLKRTMEAELLSIFSECTKAIPLLKTESAQSLAIEVRAELFLVVPNRQKVTGADLHSVTMDNYSTLMTDWKDSQLFEFASLYQEEAEPPKITSQPTSHKDVIQGRSVDFTIKATGVCLYYQWQWKPAGKEGEQNEWQNLSRDGATFQEVEPGLKLTSVQSGNAGDYRCVVSNSAGSEISQCASLTVVPQLVDLVNELHDVNNWLAFGLYLGIKIGRLRAIEMECTTIQERRLKMLEEWQNTVTPTWSAVVQALVAIGRKRLASELAQKHGIPTPEEHTNDEPLEQLKSISQYKEATGTKLCEAIQNCRGDLKQHHERLADIQENLMQSQELKVTTNENARESLIKLEKLRERVKKIVQEKSIIEMKLKFKERECQLLSEMKVKDEEYNRFLQEKITKKKKKIKQLKEELERKECEFLSVKQEAQTQQEELSHASAEVKKKHEEVKLLEREKEKLASSYNIKKEQISHLVQIAVALTSDKEEMKQQIICMRDESQQIEACTASIHHFSEEIEALRSSLQKKEAIAAQLQVAITPEQLLESLAFTTQIAELERRLQEAEYYKQQAESKRETAVEEVKARQEFELHLHEQLDESPKITSHPESLKEVCLGKAVSLTVKATGSEHLSYQWQWKPTVEGGGSKEWQALDVEGSELAKLETRPQRELQTPLKLRWRKGRNILWGMSHYPKTVQLHNNLYVGGGTRSIITSIRGGSTNEKRTVQQYNSTTGEWNKLPEYDCFYFGMSTINGHLTLVGGRDIATRKLTKKVGVWNPSSQQWTQPYPPMNTPRHSPEVATYYNYLLAAGGRGDGGDLTTVEVLDVRASEQWLTATQLPVPCSDQTSAILHDNWYIVTYNKQVMYASLPELCTIPQTVTKSATTTTPARWQRPVDSPLEHSTAIALRGSLLTVGGYHDCTTSTAIHLYHPETNTWTKVGDLPTPREYCSATVLPNGELLVSGGQDQPYDRSYELPTLVDIATILD